MNKLLATLTGLSLSFLCSSPVLAQYKHDPIISASYMFCELRRDGYNWDYSMTEAHAVFIVQISHSMGVSSTRVLNRLNYNDKLREEYFFALVTEINNTCPSLFYE